MDRRIKYDSKRKRINLTITKSVEEKLISKFGKYPNANEVLQALLENKVTIYTKVTDTNLIALLNEFKKIGNNINQIAFIANATKQTPLYDQLNNELDELKTLIKSINK